MIAYIGGKYRQAKWINTFIPKKVDRYVEIFGGAMWNYIKGDFEADEVIYNDFNRFMANLFACCKEYDTFIPLLEQQEAQDAKLFESHKKDLLPYIKGDKTFDMPDFEVGRKYVYLVTQIFSGIMSEKAKMVDLKGKYRSKYYSFLDRLKKEAVQGKLSKLRVFNQSYDRILPLVDDGNPNTYIYLDPPYYGTENLYAFHNFDITHHEALADMLVQVKSKWLLSYYEFEEMKSWYPSDKYIWEFKDYKKASMAAVGKKQTTGTELLVMNYKGDSDG